MNKKMSHGVLVGAMALVLGASPVLAANPHFVSASGTVAGNGDYTVAFKLAGLGNGGSDTITLTGSYTATWYCTNRGNKNPPGLYTSIGTVSVSGDYTVDQNGQITNTITGSPTPALCPNGMLSTTLVSSSWTSASLSSSSGATTTVN